MDDRQVARELLKMAKELIVTPKKAVRSREAEKDMSREVVSKLYLRLHKWVTKFVTSRPASPISIQMLDGLKSVEKQLKGKMRLTGREAVVAFCQACSDHFNLGSLPLATLGKKYGNRLIEDMLEGW